MTWHPPLLDLLAFSAFFGALQCAVVLPLAYLIRKAVLR